MQTGQSGMHGTGSQKQCWREVAFLGLNVDI